MSEADEIRALPMPARPAKLSADSKQRLNTPGRESYNLEKFGTRVCVLTPGALLQAAERDLRVRASNRKIAQARRDLALTGVRAIWADEDFQGYGFLAKHVRAADPTGDPAAVLEGAILGRQDGLRAGRTDRLRLYRDRDTLLAALRLAQAQR